MHTKCMTRIPKSLIVAKIYAHKNFYRVAKILCRSSFKPDDRENLHNVNV